MKEIVEAFIADDQTARVEQPADRAFDFPAMFVASQFAIVLRLGLRTVLAMGTDQLNPLSLETVSQRVAVGGEVVQQALRFAANDSGLQQRFNQRDLGRIRACHQYRDRQTMFFGAKHDLRAFAFLGGANLGPPFLTAKTCRRPEPRAS